MNNNGLLHRPVSPFIINQRFGENNACVSTDGQNHVIVCDGLNPPPGYTSLYGTGGHTGLDLRATHSQPVYCAQDGVVYKIDTHQQSGLDVRVESVVEGRTLRHIYEHLLGYQPQVGDTLKTGDLIGWADNTGYSSGDHLHFQVEELIDGTWVKIDPLSVLSDLYAPEVQKLEHTIGYLKEQVARLADMVADYLRNK